MANTRISDLAAASNLTATDLFPAVSTAGVGPVKMTGLQFAGGLLGSTVLTGSTVTTSQPLFDLTQTWNAGAVTFSGIKLNITDTASAAASLLLDLQVGGVSKLKIDKNGYMSGERFTQTATYAFVSKGTVGGISAFDSSATNEFARISTSGLMLLQSTGILFGTNGSGTVDTYLTRRGAANLRFGAADAAAPVAQTLSVQSVVAGTSNTAGADLTITGSQGTGTGAGGSIIFQVAPAGSTGTAQNALATALTITSAKEIKCAGPLWVSNAYTAGAPTADGYLVVYDSTGTAYKIPAVAV